MSGFKRYDEEFKQSLVNLYQTGKTQIHNLGVQGGTDAVRYRFSTTYTNQGGIVPTTKYERL